MCQQEGGQEGTRRAPTQGQLFSLSACSMLPAICSTCSQGFSAWRLSMSCWKSGSMGTSESSEASEDLTEIFCLPAMSISFWSLTSPDRSHGSPFVTASSSPGPSIPGAVFLASLHRRSSLKARRQASEDSAPEQYLATAFLKSAEPVTLARTTVAALGPSSPMNWMPSVANAMASSKACASDASSSVVQVSLLDLNSSEGVAAARSFSLKRRACTCPVDGLWYASESSPPSSISDSSRSLRKSDSLSMTLPTLVNTPIDAPPACSPCSAEASWAAERTKGTIQRLTIPPSPKEDSKGPPCRLWQ
mmetsp:Transcript_11792/g.26761  ORF Transcript_11792/g.26761 Transcript_11792/m.26761 type:complete len:305 (-) Transcript_11792:40-954(-)